MDAGVDLANVAVGANLHVELAVGSEGDELPVMVNLRGEVEGLRQIDGRPRAVQFVLDVVVPKHPIDRQHVERPILHHQSVGLGQSLQ